jgi:hypothetical protein
MTYEKYAAHNKTLSFELAMANKLPPLAWVRLHDGNALLSVLIEIS